MDPPIGLDESHPDSIIRVSSTVLRFRCPKIIGQGKQINFVRSFQTVGTHPSTQTILKTADSYRGYLLKSLTTAKKDIPHKTIIAAAKKYINPLHQILIACRIQPESAVLDERLVFEWSTGIEENDRSFRSEAIMYELVMSIATEAMATAGTASDECINGDFAAACRNFKRSAGIFEYLELKALPQWLSKGGKVYDEALPAEARMGVCEAFKVLMLGIAQQMAVATLLMKDGSPNWSLLAKLSQGIANQFEEFMNIMISKASTTRSRMNADFFTLITFQIGFQRSCSMYFHSRKYWEALDYGLAIAMLNKAISLTRTRTSSSGKGLPEIRSKSPLQAIKKDMEGVINHMTMVLQSWEKDNSGIYFDEVPLKIPSEKMIAEGIRMMKSDLYVLDSVEPVALILPSGHNGAPIEQVDSDRELAKQLQQQLNTEEDE